MSERVTANQSDIEKEEERIERLINEIDSNKPYRPKCDKCKGKEKCDNCFYDMEEYEQIVACGQSTPKEMSINNEEVEDCNNSNDKHDH